MLDSAVADVCDAIARCHVMRVLDVHEATVLVSGTSVASTSCGGGGSDEVLRLCRARERWRLQRETVALDRLKRITCSGDFVVNLRKEWVKFPTLRDATNEAAAASVGAMYVKEFCNSSVLFTGEFAKVLEGSCVSGITTKRADTKQVTTSDGFTAAALLEQMVPLSTSDAGNASLRKLLLRTSHELRTFAWFWQRHVASEEPLSGPALNLHVALEHFLLPTRQAMQDVLTGGCIPASAKGSDTAASERRTRPPEVWIRVIEERWAQHLPLVLRMQASARRTLARHRYRHALAQRTANKRLRRYKRIEKQLVPNALEYLRRTQPLTEAYARLIKKIGEDQFALEEFYEHEEQNFQNQWNQYVRKMTHFFLHECPLDQDWIAQRDTAAATGSTAGIIFINVKSGRTQTENPNALKVVAAKNREWMKATRERQARLAKAAAATENVNNLKAKLAELSKKLEANVFL